MSFEKVIGYGSIKKELVTVLDVIKNKKIYEDLGATIPKGIMLYGVPGVGKTLIANSFIEASGMKSFLLRKTKGDGDFVKEIKETFEKAKENVPSIVFLDDMDKFSSSDEKHLDAEEYVAVQSGIDNVKNEEVLVIATVNDVKKLPKSLTRSGRFDKKLRISKPDNRDSKQIIAYYLKNKRVDKDINIDDINRMITYNSCATLESIINEAAIYAGAERKTEITIDNIVNAVLKLNYGVTNENYETDESILREKAVHEAGHLVISEVLLADSVGLASINVYPGGKVGGFVHLCEHIDRRPYYILGSLAGKAAVELRFGRPASGCGSDLSKTEELLREGMEQSSIYGFDTFNPNGYGGSSDLLSRQEAVLSAEMTRYMYIAKDIILKNEEFFDKITDELLEKKVLLYSDIQRIKKTCEIREVEVF